jgi:hypothetical protein
VVEDSEPFVGLDVSKDSHAVAFAKGGRGGVVRSHGEIGSDAASVRRLVCKLVRPGLRLRFCHEAGPMGYALKHLIEDNPGSRSPTVARPLSHIVVRTRATRRTDDRDRTNSDAQRSKASLSHVALRR